jgi:hypothetical protein
MRMMVDARQASLVTTPLNGTGMGYRINNFIAQYSGYVTTHLAEALGADATLPDGYPSPTATFPVPTSSTNSTYATIVDPAAVAIIEAEKVNLVSFGLYVDYLSDDTLLAYRCALNGDEDDDECTGLTERDPLTVLPFYAVNVASLGDWESAKPLVASVAGATYTNQGSLATVGGIVTGGKGASAVDGTGAPIPSPVTTTINRSNSGLTGTAAIDLHDDLASTYVSDSLGFIKSTGSSGATTNNLIVNAIASSTLKVNAFLVTFQSVCNYSNQAKVRTCTFDSPLASKTLTFANYVGVKTQGQTTTITDRKICLPTHAKIGTATVSGAGTATETTSVTLSNLAAVDYTLLISVVDQATACPSTGLSMTP